MTLDKKIARQRAVVAKLQTQLAFERLLLERLERQAAGAGGEEAEAEERPLTLRDVRRMAVDRAAAQAAEKGKEA